MVFYVLCVIFSVSSFRTVSIKILHRELTSLIELWDSRGVEGIRVSVGGFVSTGAYRQFPRHFSSLDCHPLICGLTLVRRCAIVMLPWLSEARPFLPKVLIETLRSPFGLKGTAVLSFVWQICYSMASKAEPVCRPSYPWVSGSAFALGRIKGDRLHMFHRG